MARKEVEMAKMFRMHGITRIYIEQKEAVKICDSHQAKVRKVEKMIGFSSLTRNLRDRLTKFDASYKTGDSD